MNTNIRNVRKRRRGSMHFQAALLAACLGITTIAASAAAPVISFDFDEATADSVVDSVNSLAGAVAGGAPTSITDSPSGRVGDRAIQFESGDYIRVEDPDTRMQLDPDDPSFTLQAWVKFSGNPGGRQVFFYSNGPGGAISFSVNTDRTVFVTTLGILDASSQAAIPDDDAWHHIAVVHENGVALRYYVDGVLGDTRPYDRGVIFTRTQAFFSLGAEATGGLQYVGSLDRLKVTSGALAPEEFDSKLVPGEILDTDKDGMPDYWETKYGLSVSDPSDAALDPNGNGISNLDEFKLGLDPTDATRPTILSAVSTSTFDTVKLTFSKPLDPAAAAVVSNYSINPSLAVTAVAYKNKVVTLTTAKQKPDTAYTVTLGAIKDISNFEVPAASKAVKFFSYTTLRAGVLKFAYYSGIPGTPVDNLWADPKFPDSPDMVQAVFSFNSRDAFPDDSHDNYGAMIEGYVSPTESGQYHFFLRSDDASELYISTDDTVGGLQYTAWQTGCCNAFSEPGADFTTFDPISLTAGKKYFIRLIYKEGGGGDYGQVAWRKVGDETPAASLTPIPGMFLSAAEDLPAPAEGGYVTRTPAPSAKNVNPLLLLNISHRDGKVAWTEQNTSLMLDGAAVASSFSKVGNVATLSYKGSALLASDSEHTVTVSHLDPAGDATSDNWSFTASKYKGPVLDQVGNLVSLINGTGDLSDDGTGVSGKAGDRAINLGKGGASALIPDASFLNAATSQADALTFSIWSKGNGIRNSSIFWADSPSSSGNQRGFQAHVPWGNNNIYFDTAGCCDGATQRISAGIATLTGYTDETWWDDTTWHHFAFTKDGATKKIWVDGKLFLEGENTGPLPSDFTRIWLGAEGGTSAGGANNMNGLLDDYAVFGSALGESDIAKLVAGDAPTTLAASTKILAYWNFDKLSESASPATLGDGLTAYWSFDGNLSDPVGGFNGTARGTAPVAYGDSKAGLGKALELDGSNFVEITGGDPNNLQFPGGSMSIGGWFKVGAFDKDWQALLSKGEGSNYRVARRGGGNAIAYAGGVGEGADDAPNVNDGNWHHFVAVSDATAAEFGTALYIDGVRYGVNATAPVLADGDKNLYIGENPEALNRRWVGSIDDIGIWNRVLSAGEVGLLYNGGAGLAVSAVPGVPAGGSGTGGGIGIARTATSMTLTYEGTLQSSDSILGPFTDVAGAASPATIPFSGSGKFYRTRQ